jgi:hypothetical protein
MAAAERAPWFHYQPLQQHVSRGCCSAAVEGALIDYPLAAVVFDVGNLLRRSTARVVEVVEAGFLTCVAQLGDTKTGAVGEAVASEHHPWTCDRLAILDDGGLGTSLATEV